MFTNILKTEPDDAMEGHDSTGYDDVLCDHISIPSHNCYISTIIESVHLNVFGASGFHYRHTLFE